MLTLLICEYRFSILARTVIAVLPDQLAVSKENLATPLRSVIRFWRPGPDRYTGVLARGLLSGPITLTWRRDTPQKTFKVKATKKKSM